MRNAKPHRKHQTHSKKHFDAVRQDAVQHDGVVVYLNALGVVDYGIYGVFSVVVSFLYVFPNVVTCRNSP